MRRAKGLWLLLMATSLIVPLVLSCTQQPAAGGKPAAKAATREPIKLGALFPITGLEPDSYPKLKRGMEFAMDEVGREVAGRKVELLEEDTTTEPAVALDKTRKMVENDKVDAIFGPLYSHEAIPVAAYLAKAGKPLISFRGWSMETLKFNNKGKVFMPLGTIAGIAYPMGLYAYDKLGYRTAVTMFDDYDAGQQFTGGFEAGFTQRGGKIIQKIPSPLGTMDFASYLPSIKQADVVAVWYIPPTFQVFQKQYKNAGLKMPVIMLYSAVEDENQLTEMGSIVAGVKSPGSWSAFVENETNKKFVESYQKKYNQRPGEFEQSGYMATFLYLQAAKATDGDVTLDRISDALLKLKVDTVEGPFSFSPEGIATGNVYIFEATKLGDKYVWKQLDVVSQILRKAPNEPAAQ